MLDVIIDYEYVVQTICEYVYVLLGGDYIFDANENCVKFGS